MRTPYALKSFCAFHVISVGFYSSANEMQGRVANITVLFSHCVKKKATLEEEEFLKEIRISSRDKSVSVSIEFRSPKFAYFSLP